MSDVPRGSYLLATESVSYARLQTGRIGLMRFEVEAPVTAGELHLRARSSELILELDLAEVRVGNPLMQSAARALVGTDENSRLRFDATGSREDPLRFEGSAQAGDVIVPMEVVAAPGPLARTLPVTLSGWARFTDVHIPLPGMGRVNTVEVDVTAQVMFLPA